MTAPTTSEIVAVAAGGVIGTGLRWGLDLLLPHAAGEFPTSTLITNLLGTFLLAALIAGVWMRPRTPVWVKAGLGPGVLGTYTTFSAVALALVTLVDASRPGIAALYFVLSLAGGLGAAVAGIALGSRALARRAPEPLE